MADLKLIRTVATSQHALFCVPAYWDFLHNNGTKRLLAEFPNKTFATHNCEASAVKIDDTVERSTDNLPVEENEKLLLNKKYSIISVTFC